MARKISIELANKLIEKNLDGFYYEDELERVYPYGQVAGQIIGCLDSDGAGYTGLEAYYDYVLRGTDGVKRAQAGVGGAAIPGTVYEQVDAIDGQDIMVTLDIEMQTVLEEQLTASAEHLDAENSSGVLMDASTGEIYAAASLPLFNPSNRNEVEEGATLVDTLISSSLAKSKREAREFVTNGAVSVNGDKETDLSKTLGKNDAIGNKYIVIRRGKKLYALVKVK